MIKTKPWIYEPKATTDILKKYDIRLKKRFGQNFLIDGNVIKKIIASAKISGDDFILEIGPGIGSLTQHLAYEAGNVVAVEIDERLIPILSDTLSPYGNAEVIQADVLKLDIKKLIESKSNGRPVKVVANLPYYITTPVIMELLKLDGYIASMTLMLQKEVAARIVAEAAMKEYGALTLAVQYYCDVKKICDVSANCFIPRPDVTSTVLKLDIKKDRIELSDDRLMFELIKAAFAQRRKTLINALNNSGLFGLDRKVLEEALQTADIDSARRGETLTLEDFARLANKIFEFLDN